MEFAVPRAQGREYQSVGGTPAGALGAASQDTHFMAKGEELEMTDRGAPAVEQAYNWDGSISALPCR
jgi:hypothetical protein